VWAIPGAHRREGGEEYLLGLQAAVFDRFLQSLPTGQKTDFPAENLTERRFRKSWALTDRGMPERQRFAEVACRRRSWSSS
jgi:hypothetical protein